VAVEGAADARHLGAGSGQHGLGRPRQALGVGVAGRPGQRRHLGVVVLVHGDDGQGAIGTVGLQGGDVQHRRGAGEDLG
jgi:hypothetical protein